MGTENSLVASTDSLDGELGDEEEDDEEEVVKVSTDPAASDLAVLLREGNRLRATVEEMNRVRSNTDNELVNLRINLEEAKNENVTILQELEKTRTKLSSVERVSLEKEALIKKLESSSKQDSLNGEDPPENSSDFSATQDSSESLRNRLKVLEAENAMLKAKYAIREEASDGTQFQQPLEGDRIINSDLPASGSSSSLLESSSSFLEQSTSSTSDFSPSKTGLSLCRRRNHVWRPTFQCWRRSWRRLRPPPAPSPPAPSFPSSSSSLPLSPPSFPSCPNCLELGISSLLSARVYLLKYICDID